MQNSHLCKKSSWMVAIVLKHHYNEFAENGISKFIDFANSPFGKSIIDCGHYDRAVEAYF